MSFCNNCGCTNPDESLFCWKCGSRLVPHEEPAESFVSDESLPDTVAQIADEPVQVTEQPFIPEPPVQSQSFSFEDRVADIGERRNTIDLGPRSIDLGPSEQSARVQVEKPARGKRERPAKEKREHQITAPADPFNAKIAVMITGIMSILIACYCLFGYKPTYVLNIEGHSMEQLVAPFQMMSSTGIGGIMPSDIMAVCVTLTAVVAVISAIRAVPMITGLAGLITTALYYNMAKNTVLGIDYTATISMTSMMTLVVLWIVVIVLSVFQFAFLKKFSASCEDEPYPLIRIWFGKL